MSNYIGSYTIDDTLTFYVNTHQISDGAEVDADAVPTYRIYEDETGTPLLTGSMAKLDDANTVGFYSEQITLSAANGFETSKSYCIRIVGVVNALNYVDVQKFQMNHAVGGGGYDDGHVWIDTVNGVAGTIAYHHGTSHRPVSNLADALTIAAAVGLRAFHVANGSAITLTSTYTAWHFQSEGSGSIALGGQQLTNVQIDGFVVSGVATTGLLNFTNCAMLACTLPTNTRIEHSVLVGPLTLGTAGDYFIDDSEAGNIGGVPLTIDFGAAVGSSTVNLRKWSGTVSLANMGQTGTDSATIAGEGRLEIAASSQNSTVRISGHMTLADSGTNMTFVQGPNYRSLDNTAAILNVQADTDDIQVTVAAILAAVDTEVAAIKAKTDQLVFTIAGQVDSSAVTLSSAAIDSIWDEVVDGLRTARESLRLANTANAGKLSGAATPNVKIRDLADTKDRIDATVDADGNRLAVILDLT